MSIADLPQISFMCYKTRENPGCDLAPSRKRRWQSSTQLDSKYHLKSSPELDSKRLRQSSKSSSTWFLEDWLKKSTQEKAGDNVDIIPPIERASSPQILAIESLAASEWRHLFARLGGVFTKREAERIKSSVPRDTVDERGRYR